MSQILVVDDNSRITSILQEMFSELGHEVLTASNVYEAQESLEGATEDSGGFVVAENIWAAQKALTKTSVDLVVTDIEMPGPSGIELIAQIKSKYPETKIIAISSGGDNKENLEKYIQEAKLRGAVRFLPKPFKVRDLVAMVKEVLEEDD